MPHKRKRKANAGTSDYEQSRDARQDSAAKRRRQNEQLPRKRREDGVSRSMARMLAQAAGIKPPSGLDDGDAKESRVKSKKASSKAKSDPAVEQPAQTTVPAILPGERLADYSARVDAALPLKGKMKKGKGPIIAGIKHPQTKTERRMQRMQAEWRLEDAKIKAKRQDEADDMEDELDERLPGVAARRFTSGKKNDFDDPWAVVAKSRAAQEKQRGLIGLHDVVQEPPRLKPQKAMPRSEGV